MDFDHDDLDDDQPDLDSGLTDDLSGFDDDAGFGDEHIGVASPEHDTGDSIDHPRLGEFDPAAGTDWLATLPGFDDVDGADLGFEPLDPAGFDLDPTADTVAGDPEADSTFWLYQGDGNGTCAPTSVAMAIADIVDQPMVTNDAVVERALELGLIEYDPSKEGIDAWSGMTDQGIMMLCESFGLDVSLSYGSTEHLVEALESGRTVMVGIDADEIWYDAQDDSDSESGDAGFGANHEVVVTGIDVAAGVVYLNDPGSPDGQGSAIPLAQFEDAWGDAANSMIVTDFSEDLAADQIDLTPISDGGGQMPGFDEIEDFGVIPADERPEHPKDPGFDGLGDTPVPGGLIPAAGGPLDLPDQDGPDGLLGVILLPFTFIVRMVDEIVS